MFKLQFENPLLRQYAVVIAVNLCLLASGLGLVWPSPVMVKLSHINQTILPQPITEHDGSWIVSIASLTGMLGNLLMIFCVELLGRKCWLIMACLPKIIAGFVFTFASDVWMLLLGRGLMGLSDSAVFTLVPMYASEIASKEVRGSLGVILQILCSLGVVTMLAVGPFISYLALNIFFTSVTIISTLPLFLIHESPYFLYSKGKKEEAVKVLTFYRGTEALAHEEMKEYELAEETTKNINRKEIIKNKLFIKSLLLVTVIGWCTQFVGFNVVSFYLQTILESTQTSVRSEIASAVLGMIQLVASISTTFITDRFGRKTILTGTSSVMGFGMLGLGIFFQLKEVGPVTGFLNFVPLISLIMVVYGYSAGLGSLFWVLAAELFDDKSRGIGMSLNLINVTFISFLATKYFAQLISAIGPAYTYWIFSINCLLMCVFIMFCIPETKGRSFAEIQDILRNKKEVKEDNENNKTKC